jgi:hypothetical protein
LFDDDVMLILVRLNSRATLRARSQSTSNSDKDRSIPNMMLSGGSRRIHAAAVVHAGVSHSIYNTVYGM